EESVKKNTKKLSSINKTPSFNRLRLDDTFSNDGIRTSNLDDKIKDIVFGDNELVRDLGDDKIPYAHVFIPSKIDTGERNTKLHYITSAIYGLNPSISKGRLINYIYKVNSSVCEDSMDREEVEDICNKVYSKGPLLYENKTRRYLFNPNAKIGRASCRERV